MSPQAHEKLTINTQDDPDGFRIIALSGPLVLKTIFEFQDAVRADNPHRLILDVSGVEYMDSAGLGAILGAYASYQRKGKRLALVGVNRRLLTLLEVTRTDQFLTRFDTIADAKQTGR